ncbi:MAG: 17 protein [Actinomycetota bacterium]|nr:17 protein [Actinomycetota bacterium]
MAITTGSQSEVLLTARDAAELLAVPHTWVLAEARCGRLPHVRLGRYVRFQRTALDAWLREQTRGPSTEPVG